MNRLLSQNEKLATASKGTLADYLLSDAGRNRLSWGRPAPGDPLLAQQISRFRIQASAGHYDNGEPD